MYMQLLVLTAALLTTAQPQSDNSSGTPVRARGNLQQYFSTDDYPEGALERRAEGTTAFSVDIDERGLPTRCTISQSAGDPDLDRATCDIMMSRARLTPARDARGRPVPDRISTRIRWVLPDPIEAYPFAPMRMTSTLSIHAGRFQCHWTADRQREDMATGNICSLVVGQEATDLLRSLGGDAELTMIILFHPDGTAAPEDPPNRGEELLDLEIHISVAADGGVADCRTTRRRLVHPVGALHEAPDLCLYPMFTKPQPFWMGEGVIGNHFATATMRLYLRRDPAR
jgi:TonB family protein